MSRLCVLLIDDNVNDIALAEEAFSEHELTVHLTTDRDSQAALSKLHDPSVALPDVVLLDVNMPGLSGFELLKAMKDDPILQHIPVVMLSTSDTPRDVEQAYTLHASSYLVKSPNFLGFASQVDDFVSYWRRCRILRRGSNTSGALLQ